jgi:transcriptional regulator with XRE-family HTH domain
MKKQFITNTSVAEYLKAIIKAQGITQSELAELTCIAPSNLTDILQGRRALNATNCVTIGLVLGVSPYELGRMQSDYKITQVLKQTIAKTPEGE